MKTQANKEKSYLDYFLLGFFSIWDLTGQMLLSSFPIEKPLTLRETFAKSRSIMDQGAVIALSKVKERYGEA